MWETIFRIADLALTAYSIWGPEPGFHNHDNEHTCQHRQPPAAVEPAHPHQTPAAAVPSRPRPPRESAPAAAPAPAQPEEASAARPVTVIVTAAPASRPARTGNGHVTDSRSFFQGVIHQATTENREAAARSAPPRGLRFAGMTDHR